MKLQELQPGKEYFVYNRDHWIGAGYGETYYKVAQDLRHNRYTPVFKDGVIQRDYKGRVYMMDKSGYQERVVLRQIRTEFFEAVALITKTNQERYNKDKARAKKHAEHLKRKAERERDKIETPIKEQFYKSISALAPRKYVSSYTQLDKLPIEVMQAINEALLKTGGKN
jgi:hypothetical protein